MILAEQLEFDFFAPPEHEKPKTDKKPAVSTAIKDEDILNYQLNRDGSRKLQDFGEDLHNTRKGRSVNRSTEPYKFIQGSPEELEKRLASESLDKIWPKSSILELHKDNPEAAACLWLVRSTLRGRRPAKDTFKFRRYLHTASAAIALHRQVVNGELAPEAPTDAFDHFYEVGDKYKVLAHISTKYWPFIGAYSIGDAQDICRWNALRLSDDTDIRSYQYQCILPGCRDNKQLCLKNSEGKLFPYYAVAVGNSEKEFEANIEKQLKTTFGKLLETANQPEKEQESKPKPALSIKLYGRGVRNSHTYEVYGKSGTIEFQLTDKIAFESDEAFWNYVNAHRTELENKYREFRAEFSKTEKDWRSGSPIRDRVGPDYREGTDATPEMFMNTFGFRGVEFGNWVKQGKNGRERQWMLNNAYDSLLDLSKILGIPPKAVALDGELGLCFGSRGHGSASAHYEPANRLINLTKTKGYSCLAHEWFHALDHYLMRTNYREKLDIRMLSEQVDSEVIFKLTPKAQERINEGGKKIYSLWMGSASRVEYELKTNPKAAELARRVVAGELDQADINLDIPDRGRELVYKVTLTKEDLLQTERGAADKIRPELHHAWAETIDTIRSTAMHRRMLKKKAYWNSKTEEAARSFEAYVEVRSQELGITNDFLTNGAFSERTLDKESYYPYLDGVDVQRVSEKFKSLFEEIKTKETNKGVALYSQGVATYGTKISEVQDSLNKKFGKKTVDALIDSGLLKIISSKSHTTDLPNQPKFSAWELKTGQERKHNILVPEDSTTKYFAFLRTNSKLYPYPIPLFLKVGEDKGKGWGFGQKHREGAAYREKSRALPNSPSVKDDADRTFLEIFSTLEGRSDIYEINNKISLVGKKKAIIFEKLYKNSTLAGLGYVTTLPEVKNLTKLGKRIGSGHLLLPDREVSATSPQSKDRVTTRQNDGLQLLGTYAPYDHNEAPHKNQDTDLKETSSTRTSSAEQAQGFYDTKNKQSVLIAENLKPVNAPAVLLHEVGVHMAYDTVFREKMAPIIETAPKILMEALRNNDPAAELAATKLQAAGISPNHPHYKEETCAYLVEACAAKQATEPKLTQWYKRVKSAISVWMINHGFKDCTSLTPGDLVTIAQANLKTIARFPELVKGANKSASKAETKRPTALNKENSKQGPER